ncbi:MAG: YeeE/YedE family protein [Crocinitomicaceae bacterium]
MIYLEWYFAGPLLGLIVLGLLFTVNVQLGVSSSLELLGRGILLRPSAGSKKGSEQLLFVLGLVAASVVLNSILEVSLNPLDTEIYSFRNAIPLSIGAILLGFGARLANGCTAGHCIMGVSLGAKSSIAATLGFFAGGLISVHIVNQLIFQL